MEELRRLIKEGQNLHLQATDEFKDAIVLRKHLALRDECKLSMMQNDLKALQGLMEQAKEMKMANDIVVLQAGEKLADLVAERDYKYSHPAFLLMRHSDIDEVRREERTRDHTAFSTAKAVAISSQASSTKYLLYMQECGYDCLFGLAAASVRHDDGEELNRILREVVGIRSSVHRERLMKNIPKCKLQKINPKSLEKFMLSINFSKKDVSTYIKALWTKKYDTVFDLQNCEKFELESLKFKPGHLDAVVFISEGKHSRFATDEKEIKLIM